MNWVPRLQGRDPQGDLRIAAFFMSIDWLCGLETWDLDSAYHVVGFDFSFFFCGHTFHWVAASPGSVSFGGLWTNLALISIRIPWFIFLITYGYSPNTDNYLRDMQYHLTLRSILILKFLVYAGLQECSLLRSIFCVACDSPVEHVHEPRLCLISF
jgi:hypothetical protein